MLKSSAQLRSGWAAVAFVLAGLCGQGAAAASAGAEALATTQLPRGVRPIHYDVAIVPDAGALRFAGSATVTIVVAAPTKSITLNALELEFSSVRLARVSGRGDVAARNVEVDAGAQTATFTFARPVAAGTYRLSMAYHGVIATQAYGLFAIDYDTAEGRRRALFTHFESADARRFIPSWDEPAYKATFSIEATVPAAQMAVSNMPAASTAEVGNGLRRVRFAASPKMSTYLLFFGLGDFDRATAKEGATEVGVVTRKGVLAQAGFVLEASRAVLGEYNDYFALPYPLPKLDNLAVPGRSLKFSAMENWGAIQSYEHSLLLDPSTATQADRQRVFSIAAHEIAHQWFGNLVTMLWWDDLWLNEGFASWMDSRTVRKLHPEWNTALETGGRGRAMALDALEATHPVVQHVASVEQAEQAFDTITYSKGEAVVAMLEAYVGADAWRNGVRSYIKAHAYGNTVTDDLWHEIERTAARPVADIAHDFTRQPGVPLIRLARSSCRDGSTTLELEQGEFSVDRPDKAPLRWRVPVIARVGDGATASTVVSGGAGSLVVPGCGIVVVNSGQSGYYRTSYGPVQQAAIRDGFARLAAVDQLGLLDDAWAFGMAGTAPIADALELVSRTPEDADPKVWESIAFRLERLDTYYGGDSARRATWRRYAIGRLTPVLKRIGWQPSDGEGAPATVLRSTLIDTLGSLGDAATVAEARRRYALRATEAAAYPAGLRDSILGVVARQADAATWEALRAEAQAEKTPLGKDRLYRLLSTADDETLARRALELALTDEPGATIATTMIATVAWQHPDLAFDFALAHRDRLRSLVSDSIGYRYYPMLGTTSVDPAMVGKVKAFIDANIPADSRRTAQTAMAWVRQRVAVSSRQLPAVDAWLLARAN